MAAEATDVITTAEAKLAVNIPSANTDHDSEIEVTVSAISRMLDELCGPIVIRTLTAEEYSTNGNISIELRSRPVNAITTVVEYESDGTSTTLSAEDYDTKPDDAYLLERAERPRWLARRSAGLPYFFPRHGTVLVTYDAGRYASTAAVGRVFKQAAQIIFAHLWRVEQGTGNLPFGGVEEAQVTPAGFAIPNRAARLLADEMRLYAVG